MREIILFFVVNLLTVDIFIVLLDTKSGKYRYNYYYKTCAKDLNVVFTMITLFTLVVIKYISVNLNECSNQIELK